MKAHAPSDKTETKGVSPEGVSRDTVEEKVNTGE